MTHQDLVQLAAAWLARRHPIVVTEIASASEEPDALGWAGGFSTLVECKASRSDFHADKHKPKDRLGDWRYYLTPVGLISVDDLPPGWGLLYGNGRGVQVVLEAPQAETKNWRGELHILMSCLRRIAGSAPDGKGVSIRKYTIQTECRATLGVNP